MAKGEGDFWKAFQFAALLIGLAVTFHGITSKKWQELHTAGLVLSVVGTIGPEFL